MAGRRSLAALLTTLVGVLGLPALGGGVAGAFGETVETTRHEFRPTSVDEARAVMAAEGFFGEYVWRARRTVTSPSSSTPATPVTR